MLAEHDDETAEATALIETVDRLWGGRCRDCTGDYSGEEIVFSIALGFKDSPRCLSCLSDGLKRDRQELSQQILNYIRRRDCYRQAYEHACRRECQPDFPSRCTDVKPVERSDEALLAAPSSSYFEWDAGNMSCGDLVLALRVRLAPMLPGSVIKVTARDPAAPEDLPSWCRLTGHALIDCKHPEYFIRRKEN